MKNTTQQVKVVALGIILAVGASYVFAWTGPTSTPPNGNVSAPLNISSSTQSKLGSLILNSATPIQNAIGLTVFGTSSFNGAVQINSGSPQAGQVLTAIDTNGDASWQAAGSSSGASSLVFITPVLLATVSGSPISWTTISGLVSDGVPANASAVILATEIRGNNAQGYNQMYMRPNSSGQTYELAETQTSGGGAPSVSSFNQGLYPISSSGSFQWESTNGDIDGSTITLVGYVLGPLAAGVTSGNVNGVTQVIAGSNVTVTPSSGTGNVTISASSSILPTGSIGGGCYSSAPNTSNGTTYVLSCWGNGTGSGSASFYNGSSITSSCPTSYTQEYTSAESSYSNGSPISGDQSFMCIHN